MQDLGLQQDQPSGICQQQQPPQQLNQFHADQTHELGQDHDQPTDNRQQRQPPQQLIHSHPDQMQGLGIHQDHYLCNRDFGRLRCANRRRRYLFDLFAEVEGDAAAAAALAEAAMAEAAAVRASAAAYRPHLPDDRYPAPRKVVILHSTPADIEAVTHFPLMACADVLGDHVRVDSLIRRLQPFDAILVPLKHLKAISQVLQPLQRRGIRGTLRFYTIGAGSVLNQMMAERPLVRYRDKATRFGTALIAIAGASIADARGRELFSLLACAPITCDDCGVTVEAGARVTTCFVPVRLRPDQMCEACMHECDHEDPDNPESDSDHESCPAERSHSSRAHSGRVPGPPRRADTPSRTVHAGGTKRGRRTAARSRSRAHLSSSPNGGGNLAWSRT